MDDQAIVEATRRWVQSVVIGLNLCPFAERVFAGGLIRYVVTGAANLPALRVALTSELQLLSTTPPDQIETTLLIHPNVLGDFLDYNDFLAVADRQIKKLGLAGIVQIASFHPDYQFEGTEPAAAENYTNRSPYPMLHLLREESVSRAVDSLDDPDEIPRRNVATMNNLGLHRVAAMLRAAKGD